MVLVFLFWSQSILAQNLSFGVAYQYQKAFQWELMLNNYNSNSPELQENQPYLNASVSANFQYVFGSKGIVHHGAAFHYNFSRSYANNVDSTNRFDMHQMTIGYLLELHDAEKLKNFFFNFGVNYCWTYLTRKQEYSDPAKPAFKLEVPGPGFNFDFKFGYKVAFGPNAWMSPFIGAGYSYAMMGDLWNFFATDGLTYRHNHFVYAKAGIQFEFRLPRNKNKPDKD